MGSRRQFKNYQLLRITALYGDTAGRDVFIAVFKLLNAPLSPYVWARRSVSAHFAILVVISKVLPPVTGLVGGLNFAIKRLAGGFSTRDA